MSFYNNSIASEIQIEIPQLTQIQRVAHRCDPEDEIFSEALENLNESTAALKRGDTTRFEPVKLKNVLVELKKIIVHAQTNPTPNFDAFQEIKWAIIDYVDIAKKMIEAEGISKWGKQHAELQEILIDLSFLRTSYVLPAKSLLAKVTGLFFNSNDPQENFFLHLESFQNDLSQIRIRPKDDFKAKKALKREIQRTLAADRHAETGMSDTKKRLLNFVFSAAQITQHVIQGATKRSLDETYKKGSTRHQTLVPKKAEKDAAFLEKTLSEKWLVLDQMTDGEFETYTRRFPETREIIQRFRSGKTMYSKENIKQARIEFLANYTRPLELSPSKWWEAFAGPAAPKNRTEPEVQVERAMDRVDTLIDQMKQELSPDVEQLKTQAVKLRSELVKSMPTESSTIQNPHEWAVAMEEQCFAVDTLEKDLKEAMRIARPSVTPDEATLRQYGNKHLNLVKMAHLNKALELPELEIPLPRGISTGQVRDFLQQHAPEVFGIWNELKQHKETHTGETSFLDSFSVALKLERLDKMIEAAFADPYAFDDLEISTEMKGWLETQAKRGNYLMVRSTGSEDSHQMANAGGNASKAYVAPTPKALCEAIGVVVRSYFSKNSLQNRLNAGINPFDEELKLAVTVQELIGEPIGGAKNPAEIPKSFVLFSSEPLYGKFRAMRLSVTYGHGEGAVSGQGIATDTAILLHSETTPDQPYVIYNNQKKGNRLAPIRQDDGSVKLGKIENPESIQNQRALGDEDLINIYRSGVLMESFFDDHPTDIEGIVKNGRVYFVQARPVNRRPLLPTYLDLKDKNPVVEKLEAEMLVPGSASVVSISKREEILEAATLEEAEHRLGDRIMPPKLVTVTQPEPENSHPVVNFSGLGMPCLYASNAEEIEAILSKIDPEHSLAVCMQRGTLNLWDNKEARLEDHIVEGFAVHPAKVAISLGAASGLGALATPKPPKDLDGLIKQLRENVDPIQALAKIKTHPELQYLRAKRKSLEDVYKNKPIPPTIQAHLKVLQQLDLKMTSAIDEMGKIVEKGTDRLEYLFHAKVLETLLFGTRASGLAHYSLLDVRAICSSIGTLMDYQKNVPHAAHGLDLILDGKLSNSEAFPSWKEFLLNLEPLIEQGKISKQDWQDFQKLVTTLKETGALPFWLTFFQKQTKSPSFRTTESLQLERFRNLIHQITPEDQKLMTSLISEQQLIQQTRDQIELFADPKSFPAAWAELKSHIELYSSDAWLGVLKDASPLVQSIAYRMMEGAVDLLDTAAKTVKSSRQFPDARTKVKLFKEMLGPYLAMARAWAEKLVPAGKIPTNPNWPIGLYFDQAQHLLNLMPDNDLGQFQADRSFSVSASILGTRTAFDRHYPPNLEGMLTFSHQNCLVSLNALSQELLSADQIQQSLLPQAVKESMEIVEKTNWGREIQRIGMQVTSKEIILRYNVPLNNHSGHLDLYYDVQSGKMVLKAHLLGQARERWGETAYWVRALLDAGVFIQDRPLSIGDQEINFSFVVTPDNLEVALKEYGLMADHSFGGNFNRAIENLIRRYESQPETRKKLEQYLLKNLHLGASEYYLRQIQAGGPKAQAVLEAAAKGMYHSSEQIRDASIDIWRLLFERNIGIETAVEGAKKGLSSTDPLVRGMAYSLLDTLVRETSEHQFAIDAAASGIFDGDSNVRDAAFSLWRTLFSRELGRQVAEETVKKEISNTDPIHRGSAYSLLLRSVEMDQAGEFAIEAAAKGVADTDQTICLASIRIWTLLVRQELGLDRAVEAVQKVVNSENSLIRSEAYDLLFLLVNKNLGTELAIDAAAKRIHDATVNEKSLRILDRLISRGQGVDVAIKLAQKDSMDTDDRRRDVAYRLLERLTTYGHAQEIGQEAAARGIYDQALSISTQSMDIWERLFQKNQGYAAAVETVKKGLSHSLAQNRERAYELLELFIQRDQGEDLAIQFAREWSQSTDPTNRDIALKLFTLLVEKGKYRLEALKAAKTNIDPVRGTAAWELWDKLLDLNMRDKISVEIAKAAFELTDRFKMESLGNFNSLVEKGIGIEEAIHAARIGINNSDQDIRIQAIHLWKILIDMGHGYKTALEIAEKGLNEDDVRAKNRALELLIALAKKGEGISVALEAPQRNVASDAFSQNKLQLLLIELVKQGQSYAAALKFVKEKSNDLDRMAPTENLWLALFQKDQGIQDALAIVRDSLGQEDQSKKLLTINQLLSGLVKSGKEIEAVQEAVERLVADSDESVRREALILLREMVKQGHAYGIALESIRQGIQDDSPDLRRRSVELAIELVQQGQDDLFFVTVAKTAADSPYESIKEPGEDLFKLLLAKRQFYDDAILKNKMSKN